MNDFSLEQSEQLYALDLHEGMEIVSNVTNKRLMVVLRVPGGWIYTDIGSGETTFVPYEVSFNPYNMNNRPRKDMRQ